MQKNVQNIIEFQRACVIKSVWREYSILGIILYFVGSENSGSQCRGAIPMCMLRNLIWLIFIFYFSRNVQKPLIHPKNVATLKTIVKQPIHLCVWLVWIQLTSELRICQNPIVLTKKTQLEFTIQWHVVELGPVYYFNLSSGSAFALCNK